MKPEDYSRRVLLAVTGLSPQVVTETLYALACKRQPPFVPTEIHLLTTAEGRQRADLALLSEEPGWFHRLRKDYALPPIDFDASSIHTIEDDEGRPLDDIRSPVDNVRLADRVTDMVRQLTADESAALHVSIAGGRKTMGFYLGYALSLFGRPQDRLSHVLVSEPFESSWDFFYPTPYERIITTRDNKLVDTRDARVELAEIPFVRLREQLAQTPLDQPGSFAAAVDRAQQALPPLSLEIYTRRRLVRAGGEIIRLEPIQFAFYWTFAHRRKAGLSGLHWSEDRLVEELLERYSELVGIHSGDYERTEGAYRRGFDKSNFDPLKSHVNRCLESVLGRRAAKPYLITRQARISGTRYHRFGLDLEPERITIHHGKLAATECVGDTDENVTVAAEQAG